MDIRPLPGMEVDGHEFDHRLFETLKAISETFSQRRASRMLGVTPQVLNRRVLRAESLLNMKLVRRSGAGSELTPEGSELLRLYERQMNLLEPSDRIMVAAGYTSSVLAELVLEASGTEGSLFSSSATDSFHLAGKSRLDMIFLDDPIHAYRRDLDFVPVAYDHLVLVGMDAGDVTELDGASFVEVADSPQRLAWEVLFDTGIDFRIVKKVRSPLQAYRLVERTPGLLTFLSGSQFEGSGVLSDETRHVISLVRCDDRADSLVDFILGDGQETVAEAGFEPLH